MYTNILESFISKLGFISQKVNPYFSNCEININNKSENQNYISGTININPKTSESEIILFESKLNKTEDMFIFITTYQSEGKLSEEVDTFTITPDIKIGYSTPKTKLLLHIVDGKLLQAYRVGKKYKFENGINESLSKLNMENKEVINMLNQPENKSNKKR